MVLFCTDDVACRASDGVFSVFGEQTRGREALLLAMLGITLYGAIFEARARYLYIYAPVYIVLAVCGMKWLIDKKYKAACFPARQGGNLQI
jgi:hypothetical protein